MCTATILHLIFMKRKADLEKILEKPVDNGCKAGMIWHIKGKQRRNEMIDVYYIEPRLHTSWFKQPKVVYDVIKKFTYWDDPSYGNGGGCYAQACKKITTCEDLQVAEDLIKKLSYEKPSS